MKIYCNKKKFPELPFCGPHSKPRGARGLSKNYHLSFDPKLGNGVCAIFCIPCACVACILMPYKPWIYHIPLKQERYQPITNFTYWPVLGSINNCNIIQLWHKSTHYYAFDEINQVFIGEIIDNMASLVQYRKDGAINTT